ncbi:MAG: class I SAM-dependent methyltransferase [Bacteroidales bacterium]|nr:class I SAM-dependent methyltransferase [Bacteroidales bacterium]MCF8345141.1 class I SAM-dependent methyltransferase [Bacteroidales bacterium]MCF8350729.1 class I SAM-dependent methyltransferase [Bacteroidales bacterium]MCF8376316.1 class I SAM-dependent methyltransferase [Bacteroidales bacterium]MCF8401009.1 class I SAM-dependent methyltransferase [Bacteroidales bacterium]
MELKLISKINCPLCQSSKCSVFLETKDYFFSGKPFDIHECNDCGFLFTNPRPIDDALQDYYKSEKYLSHTDSNDSIFSILYRSVKQYTLRKKLNIIKRFVRSGSLLDIGCGTGDFMALAKEKHWIVRGVEQNENARMLAQKKNLEILSSVDQLDSVNERYDVITLWHVLEHLPDLHSTMKIISQKIKEDGILLIALPNHNSWDARHYEKYWAAYDLPRHLYHFNRKTITALLSSYGFELKSTFPMIFDAFYVSILSEQYRGNKLAFPIGALKGLWSNSQAWKSKEYSSLIFVFQRNS